MRTFIRNMLAGFAMVSLLVVGSQFVPISGAQAATQGCSPNGVCFYNTATDTAPMLDWDGGDHNNGACFAFGSSIGGRTSYVINSSSHQWKVYTNTTCQGTAGPLYANTSGAMSGVWNNSIWGLKY